VPDPKREPGDHGIDEVNRVWLIVSVVDFHGADADIRLRRRERLRRGRRQRDQSWHCQAFAAAGGRIGVGSRSQQKVDAAAAEVSGAEPALGYAFDVRDHAAVAAALAAFAAAAGPIDVLARPAISRSLAKDISPNGFKAVVDIDLLGPFHVMKAPIPSCAGPAGAS
jgi:hypothetical protein